MGDIVIFTGIVGKRSHSTRQGPDYPAESS